MSTLLSSQASSTTKTQTWFLYMIETEGGRLYTGVTTNLKRRFEQHKTGKGGAKFFRSDPPLRLRYTLELPDQSSALKHEYRIKQLSRQQKWELVVRSTAGVELDL